MKPIILDAATKSIEIVMAAAVDTTAPKVTAHFADTDGTTVFTETPQYSSLNGTSAVTVVSAPSTNRRIVSEITLYNADAVNIIATVQINDNSTIYELQKFALPTGGTWTLSGTTDDSVPVSSIGSLDQMQIVYVGKHGNDGNDGKTIEKAKLTFGAAITTAVALSPTVNNPISIRCLDGGIYTENLSVVSWIGIEASNATLVGDHTLEDDTLLDFGIMTSSGTTAVSKPTGSGEAFIKAVRVVLSGATDGYSCGNGILHATVHSLEVVNGDGVSSSSASELYLEADAIEITGTGTGIALTSTGNVIARVSHIEDTGSGTGIKITGAGKIEAVVGNINCDTAYDVSNGELNLITSDISGTETWTGGTVTRGGAGADRVSLLSQTGVLHTVQSMQNFGHSVGIIEAADIDDVVQAETTTTVQSTAFKCYLRATNSTTADLLLYEVPAQTGISVPTANTNYYIICDYNGGSPQLIASTSDTSDNQTSYVMAEVYRDATDVHAILNIPNRFNDHARVMNQRFWETTRVARVSGSAMGNIGTRNLTVSEGNWWVKSRKYFPNMGGFDSSVADTFWTYYQTSGVWTETASQTQIDNTNYNNTTTGLATLTNNRYGNHWVYLGLSDGDIRIVYGTGDYSSLSAALAVVTPPTIPSILNTDAYKLIGKLTIQKNASTFTVTSSFTTTFGGASVTSHSDLSNLSADDHPQYLLTSGGRVPTGKQTFFTPTTAGASINLPSGTSPTSPASGDMWYNGTNLYFRDGGASTDLLASVANDDGWIAGTFTSPTRTGATTFTTTNDVTGFVERGTKLKFTDTTTKYLVVASATWSGSASTITTVETDDFAFVGNPSAIYYSNIEKPFGFPDWFDWSPTPTAGGMTLSANVWGIYKYKISSGSMYLHFSSEFTLSGTPEDKLFVPIPISSITASSPNPAGLVSVRDASSGATVVGKGYWGNDADTVTVQLADATNWSTGSGRRMAGYFEVILA